MVNQWLTAHETCAEMTKMTAQHKRKTRVSFCSVSEMIPGKNLRNFCLRKLVLDPPKPPASPLRFSNPS